MKKLVNIILLLTIVLYTKAQCFDNYFTVPNVDFSMMALGYFNNDTITDLAVVRARTNLSADDTLAIYTGNGDGTFALSYLNTTDHYGWLHRIVSADLNDDGFDDLIIGRNPQDTSLVYINTGNASFNVFTLDHFPSSATHYEPGYLDGDSILDLVIVQGSYVVSYHGFGDGTYTRINGWISRTSTYANRVSLNYFNGDSILDMVVSVGGDSLVDYYEGVGDGTFTGPTSYLVGYFPIGIVSADFDSDGDLDFAVACDTVTDIFYGDGTGNFIKGIGIVSDSMEKCDMKSIDINNDGHVDLARNFSTGTYPNYRVHISVNIGNGDGTFQPQINLFAGTADSYGYFYVADLNNDGLEDLMTLNSYDGIVLLNRTSSGQLISTAASCNGNGSISVDMFSGTQPFNYTWSTGDTTASIDSLSAGIYLVTVTDNLGCELILTDTLVSSSITIDSVAVTHETCLLSADGSISVSVSGTNPPFNIVWSNGDTTNQLSDLSQGLYSYTITDQIGCTWTQPITINEVGLQVDVQLLSGAGGCANSNEGAIAATALNGTAPHSFQWSNGSTNDTLSGLLVGGYTLTLTDDNGCEVIRHQIIPNDEDCYAPLSGRVYYDIDNNCIDTLSDIGLSNQLVRITPGHLAFTDSLGYWSKLVPTGTYTVSVPSVSLQTQCNLDSIVIQVVDSASIENIDLPKTPVHLSDVSVDLSSGFARPGFSFTLIATIRNRGIYTTDVLGFVALDSALVDMPVVQVPTNFVIDSISSSLPRRVYFHCNNLLPQALKQMTISVNVPPIPDVSLGQNLYNFANVTLTNGLDQNPYNDHASCTEEIRGAYDPNDKQVFSEGVNVDGQATPNDTLFEYLIRFQNTGTDTAFNVLIIDTIDTDLDLLSFELISQSHPVVVEFFDNGIVHFVFDNIQLPDSNINEPASHGFVKFSIKLNEPEELNLVENLAAIYFDYNPPIYTNTVSTERVVGVKEIAINKVNVFPNPTTGLVSINIAGQPIEQVVLLDILGKEVLTERYNSLKQVELDLSSLNKGLHLIKVKSTGSWYQHKVIIMK